MARLTEQQQEITRCLEADKSPPQPDRSLLFDATSDLQSSVPLMSATAI